MIILDQGGGSRGSMGSWRWKAAWSVDETDDDLCGDYERRIGGWRSAAAACADEGLR